MNASATKSPSLGSDGFEIHRRLFAEEDLELLRGEARRVSRDADALCVRHLGSRSEIFDRLPGRAPLRDLLGTGLERVRSILFDKTTAENWPVPWHQDLTIAVGAKVGAEKESELAAKGYEAWSLKDGVPHVQPPVSVLEKMITLRLHLDPATASNGALCVIPGSHRHGKIPGDSIDDHIHAPVTCECAPGDVLLMSPLLLHASWRSKEPGHRRVLHYEFAAGDVLHPSLSWHGS